MSSRIQTLIVIALVIGALWWLTSAFRGRSSESTVIEAASDGRELRIVTLLPKDAILAISDPHFLEAEDGDAWYDPDELVLGVEINGDARAYSIPFLSRHEIVNDTVGGRKIAVTW